jgi:uncharacterized damage-inducible protein DinB
MITPAFVQAMTAYNAEMNRRFYATAARLPDAERRVDRGAFWGSIHGTLCHILWADRVWLARFGVGVAPDLPLGESARLIEDFEELRDARAAFDGTMIDWAARTTEADFAGDLTWWSGATGREMVKPRALCVMQIFNHQTHHRGQAHALLTARGETTGATDIPFVLD